MKPPAPPALVAVFALLIGGLATAPAGAQSNATTTGEATGATTDETTAAAGAQGALRDTAGPAGSGAERLEERPAMPAARSSEMHEVLAHLGRLARRLDAIEIRAWAALALLASTALLAAGGLILGLRQRRAVAALGELIREWQTRVQGAEPAAPAGPRGSDTGDSSSVVELPAVEAAEAESVALQPADAGPLLAAPALGSPANDGGAEGRQPGPHGVVSPPVPEAHHQEIAQLLATLRRDAPGLAERFADRDLRERFRGEFDAPIGARLDRLKSLSGRGDELLRQRWLEPDLVTTLDALARFYSEAVEEERQGHTTGLARDLRGWLYESFGSVCRNEGWFAIDPVEPYVTHFDPRIHHAVAGRDVDGAEGRVVAIKSIGRRDPRSGAVAYKAEVIVGR